MENINICIVESNEEDRELISSILKAEGYSLKYVSGWEELRELLKEEDIHIVIMDVKLEKENGYQLCKEIKKRDEFSSIQIILISDVEDDSYHSRAIDVGADDFIKKPFSNLELQTRIKAAVIRWRNQRNLLREREFYRKAVAEEERLSSIVLDQNRYLKEAYEKIRRLNKELERANKELERIATYDMLSGLLNRRSLDHRIMIEVERSIRLNIPLSGIMLDIDHFKKVNDNYGHQCGDKVIEKIGSLLTSQLRKYDYAGRYGGEEFFIVLPNSTKEQAISIAERFRNELNKIEIECEGATVKITVSMGVAQFKPGETRTQWIKRADNAMYSAKQAGRDGIVCAE